jgi:hypothetical protein
MSFETQDMPEGRTEPNMFAHAQRPKPNKTLPVK